jgi:hypothetical protein
VERRLPRVRLPSSVQTGEVANATAMSWPPRGIGVIARTITNRNARAALIEMAQVWQRLADQQDDKKESAASLPALAGAD